MSQDVSLRDYFEKRLDDLDKAIKIALEGQNKASTLALDAQNKATEVAYQTMDKRLQSMNEFRETLRDQASKFTTREEQGLIVSRIEQDIKNLQVTRSEMVTQTTYLATLKDIQKQVEDLKLSRANLEGKATQESVNAVSGKAQFGIILAVVSTALAVFNFISRITGN